MPGDIVFSIVNYAMFTIFTICCIFSFYYLFINTISDNDGECIEFQLNKATIRAAAEDAALAGTVE